MSPRSLASSASSLQIGSTHTVHKTFSPEDVHRFLLITGDANALHGDAAAAAAAGLAGPILPGILIASLFPAIIGSLFPGALYASQTLKFRESALVDEPLVASVTVIKRSRAWTVFSTTCKSARTDALLVEGEAIARIPDS